MHDMELRLVSRPLALPLRTSCRSRRTAGDMIYNPLAHMAIRNEEVRVYT